MKKVERQLRGINSKKRTMEIPMRIIPKKRRLASGNQATPSPAGEKINTPHPPLGPILPFFALQAAVG